MAQYFMIDMWSRTNDRHRSIQEVVKDKSTIHYSVKLKVNLSSSFFELEIAVKRSI